MNIVTLCTGNVARSVMLGYMLTTLAEANGQEWTIRTAGTHVTEGSAMSGRTRDALMKIEELGDHRYGAHRSHQLDDDDCRVGRRDPGRRSRQRALRAHGCSRRSADKAVQLAQFDRYAPSDGDIAEQLRAAVAHEPSAEFDVADPAGGDQATYDACARQLWNLAQAFALIVSDERVD